MMLHTRKMRWLLINILTVSVLVGTTLQMTACSDSASPENKTTWITGQVIDSAGEPVVGAQVLVGYRPSFADILYPETSLKLLRDLPPALEYSYIQITNVCGDTIRTLCNGECQDTPAWDGLDDSGQRVVEGKYIAVVATADTIRTMDLMLIFDYHDWDTSDGNYHAITDGDGHFTLRDHCLGFGETVSQYDEETGGTVDIRITRMVNLKVVGPAGGFARADSVMFPVSGQLVLDFELSE